MNAFVLFGLLFGDEGKGKITDEVAHRYDVRHVLRYCGGPQAGHNAITEQGIHHCFAQFGSGTFAGANTYLPSLIPIQPQALIDEARQLELKGINNPLARITIDGRSPVITIAHILAGQVKEIARQHQRAGSCGMGVGETILDAERGLAIRVNDFFRPDGFAIFKHLLEAKRQETESLLAKTNSDHIRSRMDYFRDQLDPQRAFEEYSRIMERCADRIDANGTIIREILSQPVVFEGAQGALLDRFGGFAPHVTKSRSTWHNARDLLAGTRSRMIKIGIFRTYAHRHGRGPLVTEDPMLLKRFDDPNNRTNAWQESFRVGYIDLVALRYGLRLNDGADLLAITHLDRLSGLPGIPVCDAYRYNGDPSDLGDRFDWHADGTDTIIHAIKSTQPLENKPSVAEILTHCKPHHWNILERWESLPNHPERIEDLPKACRSYLDWLASPNGLNTPIGIVSYGQRSGQTLFLLEP